MPQFYGHDYYLLAIAEHATRLNKAILAIPQTLQKHGSHCCFNVLEMLDTCSNGKKDSLDLPKLELLHFNSDILFADDVQAETLEVYEKTGHDGKEVIEIIPSSNPESNCSWVDSLEKKDDIVNHQQPDCCEQLISVPLSTESFQVFDEPVSVNNFRLAVLAIPSIPVLLSRLKAFSLEDPLLTPDGAKWEHADFQCLVNTHDVYSTDVPLVEEDHMFTESFSMVSSNVNNDLSSEVLLSYNEPSTECEATAADIHSSDYITAWNHSDHGGPIEPDFLSEDIELVLSRSTSGFSERNIVSRIDDDDDVRSVDNTSTTALSVVENFVKSPDYCCQQVAGNCGIHKCLSPFVEHRDVETVNNDVLSQSVLEAPLDTLVAEEILFSKCSLLDGDLRTVEKHIWEQDKHFDEICFSEPMFQEESLPSPIIEASACLALGLEDVEGQNLKWSFNVGPGEDSLHDLAVLSDDVCVHQLTDGETFDKFHTSELDYMITCNTGHIIGLNDDMQEATSACVDSQTADVSEENQGFLLVDPLDSFIYVRARSVSNSSIYVQHSPPSCDMETDSKERQATNALTSSAASASNKQGAHIRTVAADFSGPWENVLQCIIDCAGVYLEHMKQEALIPCQQQLMDISTDITRFLLKEREKQLSDGISRDNAHTYTDSLQQSLAIVHVLRTAADLLLHACLESCITYLAANSEEKPAQIAKCCLEVHQQLLHHQCQFVEENRRHPKLSVLFNEVAKCCIELSASKILVLVEKDLQSLVCAVESSLCQIAELTVLVVRDWKCVNTRQPRNTVFVASVAEARTEMLQLFTLVILYDERHNSHIKSWCQDTGISYTGLLTQYSCATDLTDKPPARMEQMSLVCSLEVTQYTQLVCLLETRYNILLIERQYHKLCAPETRIYFADLILSSTHCIVLLAIEDLKRDWDLTAAITRFLALGLQFSHCCLILHGMDTGSSYVLEKEVLSNIYKLTAALCSLTATLSSDVSYKVLISVTDEDVAACIRDIVDSVLAGQLERNLLRPWLSADPSQDEQILLQLSYMNSLSAQKLLQRLTVSEILEKPHGELSALFPDIPDKIFKYLKGATFSLKCQQPHLSKSSHSSCVTKVSTSNSHATRTLTHCSLSHKMNNGLFNITQLTRTATPDFNNTTSVCQQPVPTKNLLHSSRADVECYSPAQSQLNTRYTYSNSLIGDQNYSFTAGEQRGQSVQQHSIPELWEQRGLSVQQHSIPESWEQRSQSVQQHSIPESWEQRGQSVQQHGIPESWEQRGLSVQQHSIPESWAGSKVDFCPQSLRASGVHDEWDEQMCDYDDRKLVSGLLRHCHNGDSGSTAGAQLTADLPGVCHHRQKLNQIQKATASYIPSCTHCHPTRTDNNHLGLAEVCEHKYQTLQEYTALRNGDESTQNKSGLLSSSPDRNFLLRDTPGDDDSLQSFHRTIAKAMHTLDIQTCNKSPASSLMSHRRYGAHSYYRPHMIDKSTRDTEFELTEAGLSPLVRQKETASLANTYGEYDHQDFNFSVSDTRDKEVPSSGLSLYAPVKIEVEDMIHEHGRLNISEQSMQLNTATTAVQKPTYCLRNAGSFHMDKPSEKVHITDQLKPSFLNDEGNSAVRLLGASDQASAPDPHSHTTGAASFGLFSTKAQRHRDIFSTSVDCGGQSANHNTVTTSPCSRAGTDLEQGTQTDHCQIYSHSFLPAAGPPDTTTTLQLLPFTVSKELRKHIKKHNSHDLHKPATFLAQGNHNSVRVSRQPHYVHKQIHSSNSDSMPSSVHSQVRNPTIQEEVQNCTRGSDTSFLDSFGGHMRNPITKQDFDNCRRQPDTSLLKNVGQIRHPITQQDIQSCGRQLDISLLQNVGQMRNLKAQDFQNYAIEPNTSLLKSTSQTWTRNPLSSDCRQPTSGYNSHTTQPSQMIARQQTQVTDTRETNLQVNACQGFTSTHCTESSTTSCAPDFASSVARSSLFQHCPATSSSGVNTDSQAALPYIPRHRVTVGLAQPFPRHNGSLKPTSHRRLGSGLSPRAGQSPPMDLLDDDVGNHSRDDRLSVDCNRYVSQVKCSKWNQHLLSCQATHADGNKLGTCKCSSEPSAGSWRVTWPTINRKRKLETRAGNQAQTALVFR